MLPPVPVSPPRKRDLNRDFAETAMRLVADESARSWPLWDPARPVLAAVVAEMVRLSADRMVADESASLVEFHHERGAPARYPMLKVGLFMRAIGPRSLLDEQVVESERFVHALAGDLQQFRFPVEGHGDWRVMVFWDVPVRVTVAVPVA